MRLLVGPGDAIEGLLFEDEPRQLELVFGSPFIQWGGQRGETFRVLTGAVLIADQRLDGLLLDMTRVRALDDPEPGDWIFLTSGDSVVVLLVDPGKRDPSANVFYSGWAQVSSEDVQWPAVVVEWPQVRSVDQARREVPDAWALTAVDADLSGNLSPVTSHVTVGEGEGPQLPIDALFEVRGDLQIGGRELPVRGLVRHVQH